MIDTCYENTRKLCSGVFTRKQILLIIQFGLNAVDSSLIMFSFKI